MKIDRVTITGADDKTDREELYAMWQHWKFVEWGILFSKSKEGSPRYPTQSKIKEFAAWGMPLSAHFCGWYSRQIMEAQNFKLFEELPEFSRFQINYNFQLSKGWEMKWVLEWAARNPSKSIIFQSNSSNSQAIAMIRNIVFRIPNIHILYDSSGGRGLETADVLKPYENYYTGYSGGLHPGNIESFVRKIYASKWPDTVWVDMESGVRTENYFDPEKATEVLIACDPFINRIHQC